MDEPQRRNWWVIAVPVTIVVLVGVIWALLAGMPFGGSRGGTIDRAPQPQLETIGEGSQQSATVGQIAEPANTQQQPPPPPVTATVATMPPPVTTTTAATQTTVTAAPLPPPVAATSSPAPAPVPAPAPAPAARELTESDATSRLTALLNARRPYDVRPECVGVRSEGYRNVGYTLEVRDLCHGDPQTLGRWRVDARTGEVFRQREDGRYLRP